MVEQVPRLVLGTDSAAQEPVRMEPPGQPPGERLAPQLVPDGESLSEYLAAMRQVDEAWRGELRVLLRAVIREGKRFARTPEGARWKEFLASSRLVRNGWLVWNVSGLDFLLRSDDDSELTPSELWQQITTRLTALDVEPLLTRLMQDLTYRTVQDRDRERETAGHRG
jgi:hypothetical protein